MSDFLKVKFAGLFCLIVAIVILALGVGVPALVNMHNDGALMLAGLVVFGVIAFAYLTGRQLWQWAITIQKGDSNHEAQ